MRPTKIILDLLWQIAGDARDRRELAILTAALASHTMRIDIAEAHFAIYGHLGFSRASVRYATLITGQGICVDKARDAIAQHKGKAAGK